MGVEASQPRDSGIQPVRAGRSNVERRWKLRDEVAKGFLRIDTKGSHDGVELDHIDAALAAFDQRDEGLRPVEALTELGLRDVGALPRSDNRLGDQLLLGAVGLSCQGRAVP